MVLSVAFTARFGTAYKLETLCSRRCTTPGGGGMMTAGIPKAPCTKISIDFGLKGVPIQVLRGL